MWLVVGLGNPGPEYERNRHNVGFLVVDELARRGATGNARSKFGAEILDATLASERLLLCKPMEFMNLSGQAVTRVARFYKIPPEKVVVIHDEIDLALGRLKLGAGGGHGGHNGIRSIISNLGSADFARVRVGVDRPAAGRDPAAHVLSDFSRADAARLPEIISAAADAAEAISRDGLTAAMNRFNRKDSKSDDVA